MKGIRRFLVILIIIFTASFLLGCWDKIELEEQGYVGVIGMDKGKGNKISITFQITNPQTGGIQQSQLGGESQGKSAIITFDAVGPLTARDISTITVARKIDLSHAKAIVIGEEFARSEDFFHVLEATLRDKQLRLSTTIIVSREKASEFIRNNKPLLDDKGQKFYEFMSTRWKDTALVPLSDLNRFMQRTETNESLFLSIYGSTRQYAEKNGENEADYLPGQLKIESKNDVELIGSAVFKKGKMIGKITGDETRLNELLREKPEFESMLISFPDPIDKKYRIEGRLTKRKRTKISLDISGNRPRIYVYVPISIEILSIPSFIDYVENKKMQSLLKKSIEKYMLEKSMALINKTQTEFKGEPFMWELVVRRKFLNYDDYKSYGWMDKYADADVYISYDVSLIGFGKQLAPPKFPSKR
jgi:Ger(x)C family germination protein